jgi:translation initation factor SUI1, putative, prokaryotic
MSRVVYSTDKGRHCPDCQQPVDQCLCELRKKEAINSSDGIIRIQRETKGRKGKGVTLVSGVPLTHDDLLKLAKELKQRCSTGGSVKNGVIEIQGDQKQVLLKALQDKGYTVKISGG